MLKWHKYYAQGALQNQAGFWFFFFLFIFFQISKNEFALRKFRTLALQIFFSIF